MPTGIKVLTAFCIFLVALVVAITAGSTWFDRGPTAWINPDSIGEVLLAAWICTLVALADRSPTLVSKNRS